MQIDAKKFIKMKSGFTEPEATYEIKSKGSFFAPSKTIKGELYKLLEEYYDIRTNQP